MGHWVYCFEVKNAKPPSEGTQMNNVSCDIDEYFKCWRQSGDPQEWRTYAFCCTNLCFFHPFVFPGIKYS